MKVGKAATATALAGLVLLGGAGSASALTLDLPSIGGLLEGTTQEVNELLGTTPAIPGAPQVPAPSVETDGNGITVRVGDVLDVQIGAKAPTAPSVPAVPATPALPAAPAAPATPAIPAVPQIDGLPSFPPELHVPATPDTSWSLLVIDFFRDEVSGMATTMTNSPEGAVEQSAAFAQRTAGMTIDLAGLASVRLMLTTAYERTMEQVNTATP